MDVARPIDDVGAKAFCGRGSSDMLPRELGILSGRMGVGVGVREICWLSWARRLSLR